MSTITIQEYFNPGFNEEPLKFGEKVGIIYGDYEPNRTEFSSFEFPRISLDSLEDTD